ncbi:MAG TPA: cytochrome P450, partial [Ramlibacter sp.]|nr:cytochrome P450 [Ramlibacter sp.]
DRFDLARAGRRLLGFGHGPHACPGQALAQAIAAAGLATRPTSATRWHYRPSVNGRMPVFDNQET